MWIFRVGKCVKILAKEYSNTSIYLNILYVMYIGYLGDSIILLILSHYTSDFLTN